MRSDAPTMPTVAGADDDAAVTSGGKLGRYRVDSVIGAGGMGVVLAAFDPELERPVALKVLRRGDAEAQEALVAEGQAMARLRHPNVVAVHDVGVVDGRVFVAMEMVEGPTMRAWSTQQRRSWREIVTHGIAAARGLAAAHRAGLVHRDIKLDNILIDHDGVARVADFGLAERGADEAPGAVVGTPAYMPPEQHRGDPLTPAADQYALAACLWEALAGAPPFAGETLDELAVAKASARLVLPRGAAPGWVFAALRRALAPAVAARYRAVDDLVAALERGLARRRQAARGATTLAVVTVTAITAVTVARSPASGPVCARAADEVRAAWSPSSRFRLATAFAASGRPHGAATASRIATELDDRAAALARARVVTCAATFERGAQSTQLLDLRMACLDRQVAELAALVDLFGRSPDVEVVDRAVDAVEELPDPDECSDAVLSGRPPPPPSQRAQVAALERRLFEAVALARAGHARDARPIFEALLPEARALGHAPLTAAVAFERATAIAALGDARAGEAAFEEAAAAAAAAKDDRHIAESWLRQLELRGDEGGDPAEAEERLSFAEVAVARADDPELRELYLYVKSDLAMALGRHAEARTALETALASVRARDATGTRHGARLVQQLARVLYRLDEFAAALALDQEQAALLVGLLGPDHLDVAKAEGNLAVTVRKSGNTADAERLLLRSIDVKERTLGVDNPSVAIGLHNLGMVYSDQGRWDEAEAVTRRAIEIREQKLGKDAPILATTFGLLANIYRATRRSELAVTAYQRALVITEQTSGPESDLAARTLLGLVGAMVDAGRTSEALPLAERALAIFTRTIGGDRPSAAEAMFTLGSVYWALGRQRDACTSWRGANDILERALGPTSRELRNTLTSIAQCLLDEGESAAAAATARRVVAIVENNQLGAFMAGPARWVLVQVLAVEPTTLVEARHQAERALADYAAQPPQLDAGVRAELASWLVAHPGP